MFKKNTLKLDAIDEVIDRIKSKLDEIDDDPERYATWMANLESAYKIRNEAYSKKDRVSADTMATITAHLAGIAMIVRYEETKVLTSKAISFVQKLR